MQSGSLGSGLDEGAILGNLGTKTQQEFSRILSGSYRWVATATPAPNDYRQLIYFADFLDVLRRWAEPNPLVWGATLTKLATSCCLPIWSASFGYGFTSWALFVDTPSDLGYSDEGYVMPELSIVWHRITADRQRAWDLADQRWSAFLFKDTSAGVTQAMREKHDSLDARITKAAEIVTSARLTIT